MSQNDGEKNWLLNRVIRYLERLKPSERKEKEDLIWEAYQAKSAQQDEEKPPRQED